LTGILALSDPAVRQAKATGAAHALGDIDVLSLDALRPRRKIPAFSPLQARQSRGLVPQGHEQPERPSGGGEASSAVAKALPSRAIRRMMRSRSMILSASRKAVWTMNGLTVAPVRPAAKCHPGNEPEIRFCHNAAWRLGIGLASGTGGGGWPSGKYWICE
jgi:hypothetical protein